MSYSHVTRLDKAWSNSSSGMGTSDVLETQTPNEHKHAVDQPSRRIGKFLAISAVCLVGALAIGACSLDGLLKSNELPPDVTDPAITQTPAGARAAYNGTLIQLEVIFGSRGGNRPFIITTGLLSDELFSAPGNNPVDLRDLPAGSVPETNVTFGDLNNVRQRARQAGGLVGDYLPEEPALRAHLYAVEGYTEVLLAELFCSGIPLSTVDYKGDYTLRPGSSTEDVFKHAAALFDTALTLAGDSLGILNLSRVSRARALLGLGDYTAAAAAVAAVPDTFRYTLRYTASGEDQTYQGLGYYTPSLISGTGSGLGQWSGISVADHEGRNGLDYRTSGDPRTRDSLLDNGNYHPKKYHITGVDTVVLASGVEARLIEAEAALHAGGDWLGELNTLRTDGTSNSTPADTIADTLGVTHCGDGWPICGQSPGGSTPAFGQPAGGFLVPSGYVLMDSLTLDLSGNSTVYNDCYNHSWYEPCYVDPNNPHPGQTKTYIYVRPPQAAWNPGTGGVAGLAPLTDPGSDTARVSLLFRERAFWLFLTGHRQGDMRRLVRQYQRRQEQVYPVGASPSGVLYRSYIDAPIPWQEQTANPLSTGCWSRD